MGERTDLPKIKPDEKPSVINHDAAKWGWISGMAAGIVAFPLAMKNIFKSVKIDDFNEAQLTKEALHSTKAMAGAIITAQAVGAIFGGLSGKQKQEKEQIEGRTVKTPSYWNTGIISGMFIGGIIQAPFNFAHIEKNLVKPRISIASWLISIGAPIIGSIMRKNELQRDFDKSVAIRDANHAQTQQLMEAVAANQQAPAVPVADEPLSFKNSVTPDEAAALAEKQAQAPAPTVEKPAHGPHHAAHAEHHEATSHAEKHEHHPHAGSHADKHEPAASHTDHAAKPEAGMAISA